MDAATLRQVFRGSETQLVAMIGSCSDIVSKTELQEVLDEHYAKMFQIIESEFPNGYRRKLPPANTSTTSSKNTPPSSNSGSLDESATPFPKFSNPKINEGSTSTRTFSTPSGSRRTRSSTMSGGKHMTEGGVGKLFTGGSRKRSFANLVSSDEDSSAGEPEEPAEREDEESSSSSMCSAKPRKRLVRGRRPGAAVDDMDQAAMWQDLENAKEIRSASERTPKKLRAAAPDSRSLTLRNHRSSFVRSDSEPEMIEVRDFCPRLR